VNQLAKKNDEEEKLDSELTCQNSNLTMKIIVYMCVRYDFEPFSDGSLSRKC
jgi:hypothetical protein